MIPSFLVVDKPPGVTSHDIVAIVRAVTGLKKVGHTGTLDPFATGVLPLALGGATRLIQYLDESIKVYDATVKFGAETDTGDPTGQVIHEAPLPTATRDEVLAVLATFVGERMQVPPQYSAVKVKGKPLYRYARAGQAVEVEARKILIHSVELLDYSPESARVLITCSRGTYARVLAKEIGEALGSAGHLSALARHRSGPFRIEDAVTIETIADLVAEAPGEPWEKVLRGGRRDERVPWKARDDVRALVLARAFKAPDALRHIAIVEVGPVDVKKIRQGSFSPAPPSALAIGSHYLALAGDVLVAVCQSTPRGGRVVLVVEDDA